jgi:hypothetical protein
VSPRLGDRLISGSGLADDLVLIVSLNKQRQACTQNGMIVDYKYSGRHDPGI